MKNILELSTQIHNKILELRKIEYFLSSNKFEIIYTNCIKEHQETIELLICNGNYDRLTDFIDRLMKDYLLCYNIKQLRKLAAELNIPFYNLLSKNELLSKLLKIKESLCVA